MEQMSEDNPFCRLRARSFVLWALVSLLIAVAVGLLTGGVPGLDSEEPTAQLLVSNVWFYGLILIWVWWKFGRLGISLSRVVGQVPARRHCLPALGLVVLLVVLSLGSVVVTFYLLSYVAPSAAVDLLNEKIFLSASETPYPALHNCLCVLFGVLVAPVVEELFFRGVLLHRWTARWSVRRAVLLTSLVFAVAHLDMIGGFAFGFVMATLYVRTRTLLVPIACHILNNAIGFAGEWATGALWPGSDSITLEQLRADLWIGLVLLAFSVPFMARFMYKNWPGPHWTAPYFA